MSRDSLLDLIVEKHEEIIQLEIEQKFNEKFRDDNGRFRPDISQLRHHGRNIIDYLINELAQLRARKNIKEMARSLSESP